MSDAPRLIMIDDSYTEEPGKEDVRNERAIGNLDIQMPKELEKAWRLYDGRGVITPAQQQITARTGERFDKFTPDYTESNACPYPVQVVKGAGWAPGNVIPCGFTISEKKAIGKDATALAIIHCDKEHYKTWWWETECERTKKITGKDGPPRNMRVRAPRWRVEGGPVPDASDMDRRVHSARLKMVEEEAESPESFAEGSDNKAKEHKDGEGKEGWRG